VVTADSYCLFATELSRKHFVAAAASMVFLPPPSIALDMDAFASAELKKDTPSKDYSADEALCLFGGASSDRAEACAR